MEESNVQPVRCPVTVCGDIHGQFVRLIPTSPHVSRSVRAHGPSWSYELARPVRTIPHRRQLARHKLPLHGRLRRQRVLLG